MLEKQTHPGIIHEFDHQIYMYKYTFVEYAQYTFIK